jgi:RNA-directed DNA polymerase
MRESLDKVLLEHATKENIMQIYYEYKSSKTDSFYNPPRVKIQMGVDGVNWEAFSRNLDINCQNISNRIVTGKYFFKPFRELEIPKGNDFGEYRTISIASISDMLVQKLIYKCIKAYAEREFSKLPDVSFAYRELKSAPMAVIKLNEYVREGYVNVFDADIKKFFDSIPHSLLESRLSEFSGGFDTLIFKYFKRFVSVDRVKSETYINLKEKENIFKKVKPIRTKRISGIPQGGVFSGLIANIYLHNFDKWVLEELGLTYDIRYIRYADDFLILYKNSNNEENIKVAVDKKIKLMGLEINWDKTNTRVDLLQRGSSVDYLGFSVSKNGIRVSKENIDKFKIRVKKEILDKSIVKNTEELSLKLLLERITFKVLGNETLGLKKCTNCGFYEARRSWLSYFSILNNSQQLRTLDTWIRKEIYYWFYKHTGKRINLSDLRNLNFVRLEEVYRKIKKEERLNKQKHQRKSVVCHCNSLISKRSRSYLVDELFHSY